MGEKTVIVNNTQRELDMKVGNNEYFVHFANLPRGSQHELRVDYNDTYHEYMMGMDKQGKKLIVTSDDCCDYKCITITEAEGKFDVQREPRRHYGSSADDTGSSTPAAFPSQLKHSTRSGWRFWKSS